MESYMKVSDVISVKEALRLKHGESQTISDKVAQTIIEEVMRYFSGLRVYSDLSPVKHARWERLSENPHFCQCSICGHVEAIHNGNTELPVPPFASNFCPDCGAQMSQRMLRR